MNRDKYCMGSLTCRICLNRIEWRSGMRDAGRRERMGKGHKLSIRR